MRSMHLFPFSVIQIQKFVDARVMQFTKFQKSPPLMWGVLLPLIKKGSIGWRFLLVQRDSKRRLSFFG